MFTLSSNDLNVLSKSAKEINIPIRFKSSEEKFPKEISPKERITHNQAASCDDDGHIFVYDSNPNQIHNHINEESSGTSNIFLFKLIKFLIFFSYSTKKN